MRPYGNYRVLPQKWSKTNLPKQYYRFMSMKFIGQTKSSHLSDYCYNSLNLLVCFGCCAAG